jgi:hypothetical protein
MDLGPVEWAEFVLDQSEQTPAPHHRQLMAELDAVCRAKSTSSWC